MKTRGSVSTPGGTLKVWKRDHYYQCCFSPVVFRSGKTEGTKRALGMLLTFSQAISVAGFFSRKMTLKKEGERRQRNLVLGDAHNITNTAVYRNIKKAEMP